MQDKEATRVPARLAPFSAFRENTRSVQDTVNPSPQRSQLMTVRYAVALSLRKRYQRVGLLTHKGNCLVDLALSSPNKSGFSLLTTVISFSSIVMPIAD